MPVTVAVEVMYEPGGKNDEVQDMMVFEAGALVMVSCVRQPEVQKVPSRDGLEIRKIHDCLSLAL